MDSYKPTVIIEDPGIIDRIMGKNPYLLDLLEEFFPSLNFFRLFLKRYGKKRGVCPLDEKIYAVINLKGDYRFDVGGYGGAGNYGDSFESYKDALIHFIDHISSDSSLSPDVIIIPGEEQIQFLQLFGEKGIEYELRR